MKSKYLIVLYLAIIAVLGISCENTDNEPDEDAVFTVIVNEPSHFYSYNGASTPYFGKTLYLFAGDIQTYLRTKLFGEYAWDAYENIVYTKENAIASATADSEGKFTFVIDKKYLYGKMKRAFAVAMFDQNEQLIARDYCSHYGGMGITSGEKMEKNEPWAWTWIDIGNMEIKANKQGAIKVRSEIAGTWQRLTQCYITTPNYDDRLYDFFSANADAPEYRPGMGQANFLDTISSPWMDFNRYGMALYADTYTGMHFRTNISELIKYPYNSQQGRVYINIKDNANYTVTEAESKSVDVIVDVSENESNSIRTVIKKASLSNNYAVAVNANKVYMFQGGQAVDEITYDGVIITEDGCICKFVDVGNFSSENNAITCTLQMQIIKEGLGAVTKVDISELSN